MIGHLNHSDAVLREANKRLRFDSGCSGAGGSCRWIVERHNACRRIADSGEKCSADVGKRGARLVVESALNALDQRGVESATIRKAVRDSRMKKFERRPNTT
jgi:hypothetical protein